MAEYGPSLAINGPGHFELLELPATVLGFLRPIVPAQCPFLRSYSKTIASISKSYIRYRKNVFQYGAETSHVLQLSRTRFICRAT